METIAEAAATVSQPSEGALALESLSAVALPLEALPASSAEPTAPAPVMAVTGPVEHPAKTPWEEHARFPIALSVSFPLEEITLSRLAGLQPGMVLRSSWPAAEDVPLSAGDVFLANVSFEPVGARLGVRLSGFAPRPAPAIRRSAPATSVPAVRDQSGAPSGQPAGGQEAGQPSSAHRELLQDLLQDLWVSLSVCVGTVQLPVEEILQWAIGDTIPLDRPVNAPVNLLLKDRVVAGGRLVLAAGYYAVQLTEIAPRSLRLPSC